jgi:arylsulfatase A-like enzyme
MAWPEDITKYKGKYDEGYEKARLARYKKQQEMGLIDDSFKLSDATYQNWGELEESVRLKEIRKMEVYAAMIDRMDQNIGRVLNKLKEIGKDENTLILFVSDNGASSEMVNIQDDFGEIGTMTRWASLGGDWANVGNTPFRYFKNISYEGGINTPLIAYWPGKIKAESFTKFPGHFIDIMSTLVDITDSKYPEKFNGQEIVPMQGESLLPVFKGENASRKTPIFWEWRRGKAVYSNSYKIVKEGLDRPWDLYNMENDPTETHNLSETMPEKVKELEALFNNWKNELPDYSK